MRRLRRGTGDGREGHLAAFEGSLLLAQRAERRGTTLLIRNERAKLLTRGLNACLSLSRGRGFDLCLCPCPDLARRAAPRLSRPRRDPLGAVGASRTRCEDTESRGRPDRSGIPEASPSPRTRARGPRTPRNTGDLESPPSPRAAWTETPQRDETRETSRAPSRPSGHPPRRASTMRWAEGSSDEAEGLLVPGPSPGRGEAGRGPSPIRGPSPVRGPRPAARGRAGKARRGTVRGGAA